MATNNVINQQGATPLFSATHSVQQTLANGTNTISFDTELFDTTSSYNNGSFTFTAPLSGYYLFGFNGRFVASSFSIAVQIHTTSQIYIIDNFNDIQLTGQASPIFSFSGSIICFMSAANTAYCECITNIGGGATLTVSSGTPLFYGHMLMDI